MQSRWWYYRPYLTWRDFTSVHCRISTEKQVEIVSEDEGRIVKGKIDVLVLQEQLWILVIEAKKAEFSLEPGIPQALAYMLDNPHPEKPSLGKNGGVAEPPPHFSAFWLSNQW